MPTGTLKEPGSTEAPTLEISNEATFAQHREQLLDASEPEWLQEARQTAWDRFQELPMPGRKDEHWRFATIERNLLEPFSIAEGVSEETGRNLLQRSSLIQDYAGRLVTADADLVEHQPLDEELTSAGVVFKPMREALETHGDLIRDTFQRTGESLGSEKFVALHQALARSGTFLYVPKNVVIEKPILTYHWLSGDHAAVFPKTLIIAEDHAHVNLVELFLSEDTDTPGFASSMSQIFAGPGSSVFRKVIQDWNEQTVSFQNDVTYADRDARVKNVAINIGARRARYENQVRIEGAGADVKLYSLTVADNDQEFDQRTLQVHAAPHAVSDLLYKNALMEDAKTIFSGLILVEEAGQQTDAYQTNRNLLLDPTAEANSLPGLEIQANDVRCSHGATTSNLDSEDLFYLQSRGIPGRIAKQLLVFGFFEEILEQFDNAELAKNVRALVQEKFNRHSGS